MRSIRIGTTKCPRGVMESTKHYGCFGGGSNPPGGTENKFFEICTRGEVVNILGRNPRTAGSNPAVYSKY